MHDPKVFWLAEDFAILNKYVPEALLKLQGSFLIIEHPRNLLAPEDKIKLQAHGWECFIDYCYLEMP